LPSRITVIITQRRPLSLDERVLGETVDDLRDLAERELAAVGT
jgi:hypothetical protein